VPVVTQLDGVAIKVLAGTVANVQGPITGVVTNPTYIDVSVPPSGHYTHTLPQEHSAFVYVFEGEGQFGPPGNQSTIPAGHIGVFSAGDLIESRALEGTTKSFRFLLVAAKPLKEPIARRGPFVMNTKEELMQAFIDYQSGSF